MAERILQALDWGDFASRSSHGAASELIACAALMEAGYDVFRAQAAHCPFDLVIHRDGQLLRVEVKSLSARADYAPCFTWPRTTAWDLLVVVGPDRVFCFDPDTSQIEARDTVRAHYGFGPPMPTERKLSPDQVEDCRRRREAGESWKALGRRYRVSDACIKMSVERVA